jgi:hypothetical protein
VVVDPGCGQAIVLHLQGEAHPYLRLLSAGICDNSMT